MNKKDKIIKKAIKDSEVRFNPATGGICSMRYFSNHECNRCLRKRLCDYISNLEEKDKK